MPSLTVVLSLAAVCAYVAVCYLNGRLLIRLVTRQPEPVTVAGAPLLGAALLGLQLWAYSLVSVPWNPITLIAPWIVAWALGRHAMLEAVKGDWASIRAELRLLRRADALTQILTVLTAVLAATYVLNLVTQPLTGFDSISMWFFKAKHFFTTQSVDPGTIYGLPATWPPDPGPFHQTAGIIRSLDYPPLFSLIVASMYAMTGGVHDTLGKGAEFVFVAAGALVVWTVLAPRAGQSRAAVFAFLVTGIWAVQSGLFNPLYTGYADYPIGILMLVSLAHVYQGAVGGRRSTWIFAILFASIAALVKLEGLPFLLAVLLVAGIQHRRVLIAPTVLVALVPVFGWQAIVASRGWHTSHLVHDPLSSLPALVPVRAALIVIHLFEVIPEVADYAWLAAALAISMWLVLRRRRSGEGVFVVVLGLQLLAYFAAEVLNPAELIGSMDRLIIQVAPAAVLLLGLTTLPDQEEEERPLPLRVELVGE